MQVALKKPHCGIIVRMKDQAYAVRTRSPVKGGLLTVDKGPSLTTLGPMHSIFVFILVWRSIRLRCLLSSLGYDLDAAMASMAGTG